MMADREPDPDAFTRQHWPVLLNPPHWPEQPLFMMQSTALV